MHFRIIHVCELDKRLKSRPVVLQNVAIYQEHGMQDGVHASMFELSCISWILIDKFVLEFGPMEEIIPDGPKISNST